MYPNSSSKKGTPKQKDVKRAIHFIFYQRRHLTLMDEIVGAGWNFFQDLYIYPKRAFIHVEIGIKKRISPKGPEKMIAYGVNKGDKEVHNIPEKSFRNGKFMPPTVLTVHVSSEDYYRIFHWIENRKDGSEGFDSDYWQYFLWGCGKCVPQSTKKWYCSKFAAHAISKCRDFTYIDNSVDIDYITPQKLYDVLLPNSIRSLPIDVRPDSVRKGKDYEYNSDIQSDIDTDNINDEYDPDTQYEYVFINDHQDLSKVID
jgi:hypothetical protein